MLFQKVISSANYNTVSYILHQMLLHGSRAVDFNLSAATLIGIVNHFGGVAVDILCPQLHCICFIRVSDGVVGL